MPKGNVGTICCNLETSDDATKHCNHTHEITGEYHCYERQRWRKVVLYTIYSLSEYIWSNKRIRRCCGHCILPSTLKTAHARVNYIFFYTTYICKYLYINIHMYEHIICKMLRTLGSSTSTASFIADIYRLATTGEGKVWVLNYSMLNHMFSVILRALITYSSWYETGK